ncbi:hypothetical protein [Streptomyces hydrogenans]|uniref:hypothetical protein n=1 Tax=Streptomyces hydrogenans TaxID=1873719 RepID=UPI00380A7C02
MTENELLVAPESVTRSASLFYGQFFSDMKQYSITGMITDHHEKMFAIPLSGIENASDDSKEALVRHFLKFQVLKEYVTETRQAAREAAIVRSVDNLLTYISDILTEAIIARPELLKSQEQVAMEDVLGHGSIEDFIQWAAERHVSQLSFKGLQAIADYIKKRLGMELYRSTSERDQLNLAVAVRNLITHRRGIIDERFIRVAKDPELSKGARYNTPHFMLHDVMISSKRLIESFDLRISEKFGIPRHSTADQDWFTAPNGLSALLEKAAEADNESQTDPEGP